MPVYTLSKHEDLFRSSDHADFADDSAIFAGNGDDTIIIDGFFSRILVDGGNGDDLILFTTRNFRPEIRGGNGDDEIHVDAIFAHVDGGRGDDIIYSKSETLLIPGNVLTGGKGEDTFVIQNLTQLFTQNDTDGLASQGDQFGGGFQVITDYQHGDRIDLPVATRVQQVALANVAGGKVAELGDGQYAFLHVRQTGDGTFTVDAAGPDLLVVYDQLDGVDDKTAVGGVLLQGVTSPQDVLIF